MEAPRPPSVSPDFRIGDLLELLNGYMEPEHVQEVYHAYLFAAEAHGGQMRLSGEPYISHPVAVARIMADMHMDRQSIIAALLHDVIEDTGTPKKTVAARFGEEVAELVDGVSKLTLIEFESQAEAQAENFRKMLLAMTKDIRVILVKLADRVHNMRTLGVMRAEKRRRIARETLEIYAPIANRLGMNVLRLELEDLGFANLYPVRYRVLKEAVKRARGHRKEILSKVETSIKRRLWQEGLQGRLLSREKHIFGIYQKMKNKDLPFSEVFDVYAFRVVVDKVDTCYRVLGAMHNLYKPVPGCFKDYIAIPKANGYQSLHTILFGPHGVPIEVQVRTEEMDRVAEAGIAAHWLYKEGDATSNRAHQRAREWLRGLLEMQKTAGNSMEFLESVKIDLFPDEVYVFTPKGEIMELPGGATAVDFAYAVHTDVGNTCVAAKIDRRIMPLRTPLANGQTVEVITNSAARPNPAWLNFVVTGKARTAIRHYQKNLQHEEARSLGRRMLDKELSGSAMSLDTIPEERLAEALEEFQLPSLDALLEAVGLGNRMAPIVARRLVPGDEDRSSPRKPKGAKPLAISGTEGMVVSYAKCCRPIPGDTIVGFVTSGRGIVVHQEGCKNIADYRGNPEKWLDVAWEERVEGEFIVDLRIEVANRRGVLATIAASIADLDSNIENVDMEERDGLTTTLIFTLTVRDRRHLAAIMRGIRSLKPVLRICRNRCG